MIVDTMNIEEVGNAVINAARKSVPKVVHVMTEHHKAYMRIVRNSNKERIDFKPLSFVTDGITFYVCVYSDSKKDTKKFDFPYGIFANINYKNKNWYCLIMNGYSSVQIYQHHFFKRYIERHLKDDSRVSVDTVRKYFRETNYLGWSHFIENPRHKNCVYNATAIGICCGFRINPRISVWLTYIDKETLTLGDKKEVFDMSADLQTPMGLDAFGNRIFKGDLRHLIET